jgi:hypothetical protein
MKGKYSTHNTDNSESHHTLFAAIKRDVQTERYHKLLTKTEKGAHPTREQLYQCGIGQITGPAAVHVRTHVAFCRRCAQEVTAVMRSEEETGQELLLPENDDPAFVALPAPAPPRPLLSEIPERIEWLIEDTGQALTASTHHASQTHEFEIQGGKVEMTCTWGEEDGDRVFVRLDWDVEQAHNMTFEIQLINPLTQKILHTISSETIKNADGKRLYADLLGLNPFQEQLAISLVLLDSAP